MKSLALWGMLSLTLLSFVLWGCGGGESTGSQEPLLTFPPTELQAGEITTGQTLIDAWDIHTVAEGIPWWRTFRIVQTSFSGEWPLSRSVYEQANTDPPKAREKVLELSSGMIFDKVQIGDEHWQHVKYGRGKEDLHHYNFASLTIPTGLDFLKSATIKNVEFIAEEKVNGFKTQHYIAAAFDPTQIIGTYIIGDFWLSTEYRFVVKAEWRFALGSLCWGSATFELTDIDVPVEIFPPE